MSLQGSPCWDRGGAAFVFTMLTPVAREAGYIVGLYGSLLSQSHGRDLDIVAWPWRVGEVGREELLDRLCRALGSVTAEPDYAGLRGVVARTTKLPDGRTIEIAVLCRGSS